MFTCSIAQQPYSLIHYDENTLPQTTIGNIEQGENGYLWMSTQFGIVRFDGETFRVFTTNNLKGLTSNRIRVCARSFDGSIYFVDENHVIIKVKSPNEFETISTKDCLAAGRLPLYSQESNNDFNYMKLDSESSFYKFFDSIKIDLQIEFFKAYTTGEEKGYLFFLDLHRKVRLCYYNGKKYTFSILSDSFKTQHTFKLNNVVYVQTGLHKALHFDKAEQKRPVTVTGLPAEFLHVFEADPPVLFSSPSGTFFYSSGQLYQYESKNNHIEATLIFKDLPCSGVVDVMREESTGDFLVSTKSTGFYRIKKKRFGVVNLTASNTATPGQYRDFNNNIVYSLALWDKQHLFFNGFITPISGGFSRNFDPRNKAVLDYFFLYPKDKEHIWLNMGYGAEVLMQSFNKQTGSYTAYNINRPKKVIELSNGSFIVIGAHVIAALQDTNVTNLYKNETTEFTAAAAISDDTLVVGTANGIYYFFPRTRKLQVIRYKEVLNVRFIFRDRSGRCWFTTYGQGLFNLSGNSIVPLPLDNARHLAISHSILQDRSGNFWVTTNHGLFKLGYTSLLSIIRGQGSKLYYNYYDKTDGFNTNEFNGGGFPSNIYQQETGQAFFPSMNGVVKFNPDSIADVLNTSPIFFDEIVLNDTGHMQSLGGNLIFPKETSAITIDFSSPYYGHTENVKFSYSLSNDPNEWKDLSGSRSIILSNLPGRSYTLTVKKEGASSAPVFASLQFTIRKNFSETVLFKLLLFVLVVALVYLFFRARLYYLYKERRRLEKIVAKKTADQLVSIGQLRDTIAHLTQLQQELEQMIKHKENILAVLIHDIKSPLYFLNTVAEHLYKGIDLNSPQKNSEIAHEISTSLNKLYLFTQDFTIWLNTSEPGQIQKREKVDLDKIVGEALAVYKEIIDKKGICILSQIACKLVYGDEPMIKSIIRNLIDNAIKNTSKGNITITSGYAPHKELCEIIIADEGKGMTEEQIAVINKYFLSDDDDILPFSTLGYGHKVIKDFVHKMHGTIRYGHNVPAGIEVTVVLRGYNFS